MGNGTLLFFAERICTVCLNQTRGPLFTVKAILRRFEISIRLNLTILSSKSLPICQIFIKKSSYFFICIYVIFFASANSGVYPPAAYFIAGFMAVPCVSKQRPSPAFRYTCRSQRHFHSCFSSWQSESYCPDAHESLPSP